jgi:S1-C subfamily serine protease
MLKLTPEKNWRVTNIERRGSAHRLEPFPEFWARPLSEDEKKNAGLKPKGFAAEVTKFWVKTNAQGAGLQVGDIVFSVDGVEEDELTESVTLFIKLNRKAGDTVKVGVLRRGNAMELSFKLKAKPW